MKIVVGSIQYSPIFKSHCCAFGKQCEKSGYSVKYVFSQKYRWMIDGDFKDKTFFLGNSENILGSLVEGFDYRSLQHLDQFIGEENPDAIYLHNIHPLNYHIARLAKKKGITFIQHIHEPFVENKSVYGRFHHYFLYLFEYLQGKLLDLTDVAVVSSDHGFVLFKKRYPKYSGKLVQVPLMYEDFGNDAVPPENRRYITFIGPPVPAKGPETFLKIVEYSQKHGMPYQFLVISRYPLDDRFSNIPNLTPFYKDQISDQEMAALLQQSVMTITPYTTARQSSVVLTAYMCGTPVLSSDIDGMNEAVHHLNTGYLVDLSAPDESWIEGIDFISRHIQELSENCRSDFLAHYSETNWQRYLPELLGGNND